MKNYYLWIGGAVVVIAALLVFTGKDLQESGLNVNGENNASTTTEVTEKTTTPTSSGKVVSKTTPKVEELTNIFPQKGNYKCVYEEVTSSTRSTNTIYFSDGKMRGEFRILGGVSNIMLYDGRNLYTWVEGQARGSVSVPKSIADFPPIVPKDITSGKVLGSGLNNVSWDCHSWIKDASLLAKPTYVTF